MFDLLVDDYFVEVVVCIEEYDILFLLFEFEVIEI